MLKHRLVSFLFLLAPVVALGGGDHAGNGAGIAENNFAMAHQRLGDYIALCLASPRCGLTTDEGKLLSDILRSLPAEYAGSAGLIFRSNTETHEFEIDGRVRIAVTGNAVGGQIFINLDLLLYLDTASAIRPVSLESAVAVLVHEFGHHHGIKDHTALDRMGAKVGGMLMARVMRTDMGPGKRDFLVTIVDLDRPDAIPQLAVSDGKDSVDLSAGLARLLRCPGGDNTAAVPAGASLFGPHWTRPAADQQRFIADLALFCGSATKPVEGLKLELTLRAQPDEHGALRMDAKSISLRQLDCRIGGAECERADDVENF